jgi:hypothetical protein
MQANFYTSRGLKRHPDGAPAASQRPAHERTGVTARYSSAPTGKQAGSSSHAQPSGSGLLEQPFDNLDADMSDGFDKAGLLEHGATPTELAAKPKRPATLKPAPKPAATEPAWSEDDASTDGGMDRLVQESSEDDYDSDADVRPCLASACLHRVPTHAPHICHVIRMDRVVARLVWGARAAGRMQVAAAV